MEKHMKIAKVIFACSFIIVLLVLSIGSSFTLGLNSNEVYYKEVKKEEGKFNVYLFWEDGNNESEALIRYLSTLDREMLDGFVLYTFEIDNKDNKELKDKVSEILDGHETGLPYLVVGNKTFDEYSHSYDERIEKALEEEQKKEHHYDVLDYVD